MEVRKGGGKMPRQAERTVAREIKKKKPGMKETTVTGGVSLWRTGQTYSS